MGTPEYYPLAEYREPLERKLLVLSDEGDSELVACHSATVPRCLSFTEKRPGWNLKDSDARRT